LYFAVSIRGASGFARETRRAFRLYLCENVEAVRFAIIAKDTAPIPGAKTILIIRKNHALSIKWV